MELRVTGTWRMCWTYDTLFLRNSLRMAPCAKTYRSWYLILSVFYDLFYCIFIIVFCWLKYGINKPCFDYDWNPDLSVSFWNIWTICLPVVEDEASLPSLQNPFLYLIISHINPVHTFITHLFMIPCNHLILLLCWNILNYHLKFEIL